MLLLEDVETCGTGCGCQASPFREAAFSFHEPPPRRLRYQSEFYKFVAGSYGSANALSFGALPALHHSF